MVTHVRRRPQNRALAHSHTTRTRSRDAGIASVQACDPLYASTSLYHELLSAEEEGRLAREIQRGGPGAKAAWERMVLGNQRLIVSIATPYRDQGLPFEDLIQEGNLGLMAAIEKFDPERGYRFSTHASWWIFQAITRALGNQSRLIRLPIHVQDELHRFKRAVDQMQMELQRAPTTSEVADRLHIAEDRVQRLQTLLVAPVSLEDSLVPGGDEEALSIREGLPDTTCLADTVEAHMVSDDIRHLLHLVLKPREVAVITWRYGLDGKDSRTLEAIGAQLAVTRERVRQIEERALRKLRSTPQVQELFAAFL